VPGIQKLATSDLGVNLAVSLSATTDEVRDRLMPINKRWPIAELLKACRAYPLPQRRRLTFEYVMLDGMNDTAEDARRLVRLLRAPAARSTPSPSTPPDLPDGRRRGADRGLPAIMRRAPHGHPRARAEHLRHAGCCV
jgi:23S rRNA (adenine2503-C2)-methyltransferase